MLPKNRAVVTRADETRLWQMIESIRASLPTVRDPYDSYLRALEQHLAQAAVVPETEISADIVTMNSTVCLRELDTGRRRRLTLVYQSDAELCSEKVSVLEPLGASILGSRQGDIIQWQPRRIPRRVQIERILFQPEEAGEFNL